MPFQLSPGVAVVEKDFTSIVPAVSSSIGAFAGAFQWGPVLEPTTVASENELVRRFGKPNDSNFNSFFTAANFLSYTNNLLLVRADAGHLNAVAAATGGIAAINITAAGSGYISTAAAPAVTISAPDLDGGVQATATSEISGGGISSIVVGGTMSGYTTATVTISAPSAGGTQATATATIAGGAITGITVTNAGTGYKTTPTVTITGDGTGATITTVTLSTSTVTAINITNAGTGYSVAPTITIAAPPSGTTATATSTVTTTIGLKINNGETYLNTYSNGSAIVGEFAAKYPGTLGNSLKVSMADSATYATWTYKDEFDGAPGTSVYAASVGGSNDEVHIIVIDEDGIISGTQNAILEKFAFASKAADAKKPDGTNNYYKNVINTSSEWIWWMDHPTNLNAGTPWGQPAASTAFKTLVAAVTRSLSGGTDDYALTDGEKQTAFELFSNAELYDISLVLAGKASATVANYILSNICESRLDCVGFISPEDVTSGDAIVGSTSTEINKIIAYKTAVGKSTSYGVMDSGYKYQYDRYNDKYRYVALNADIAGLCARTDYTNDPWFSPGGLNRGQIKGTVRLAVNPNKTQRDTLYKAGINPVVSFPGEGTVLFGDKTMLAKPSAFDRINVRRLFIVMEKAIATAAKFQLFEFNDTFTRAQFRNLVEPFLRDVQGRRGITDFVVKCDESNNTGEVIDRNEFVADIFVKPNRSINFITLNFVAARSSINFTEVGA
jgi:phage tail sheath protein FI